MTDANGPGAMSDSASPHGPRHRLRNWVAVLIGVVVVLPLLVVSAWTAITLSYTYSAGDRAGFVQKFSQKGWLCKTWEGELSMVNIPGAAQERWSFTVRDDSVAAQIVKLMGARVTLEYHQHRGVPSSCFGETEYFVVAVHPIAAAP
jgi:hypothetical protein